MGYEAVERVMLDVMRTLTETEKARASVPRLAAKILIVAFGLFIASTGVVLYMKSGLGVDAFSVFCSGVAKVLHISFGLALQISLLAIVAFIAFIDRTMLGIGTIMHATLMGLFIDLISSSRLIPVSIAPLRSCIYVASGVVLVGTGLAIYIKASLGYGAIDALMLILHKRLHKEIGSIKILMDISLASIGFLIGGSLGITTLASVIFTGPVIQFVLHMLDGFFPKHGVEVKNR